MSERKRASSSFRRRSLFRFPAQLTATTCEFPLRRPAALRLGTSGDAGRAKEPRWPQLEGRAAVANREEEEAAAAAEGDDDRALAASVLRGAVVDAAALDRARAWSMLLEDIGAAERERDGGRRYSRKEKGRKEKVNVGFEIENVFFFFKPVQTSLSALLSSFFGRGATAREQLALSRARRSLSLSLCVSIRSLSLSCSPQS